MSCFQKNTKLLSATFSCYNIMKAFNWTSTIGLEVHAQMATKSKLFSQAKTIFGLPTNSNVNLLDVAMPGTLPVLNEKCIELAVLSSYAFSCSIAPVSYFDRKHYFYADLPCGYQITQQRTPIASNGLINFYVCSPETNKAPYKKSCRLKQIQVEQDSGKSLHDPQARKSMIDLNRSGMPLLEFVFEPDLSDGEEAAALVKELSLVLERLGVCSCKMQEGALRVDANISISDNPDKLGTRTEVKNIGSIRGVANAIKFEINRQMVIVKSGGYITNETRGWDSQDKRTIPMREKELVHDYRFMPEPNLPPVRVCVDETATVKAGALDLRHVRTAIPELPAQSRAILIEKYGFSEIYAITLVNQPSLLTAFNEIMEKDRKRDPKLAWNVLLIQLLNVVYQLETDDQVINSDALGEVIDLLQNGLIDFETCRNIFELKIKGSEETPSQIVAINNWQLVSDPDKINAICMEALQRNPKAVKKVKKGKVKALQSIVNDAASLSSEKLNLSLVSKRLKKMIDDAE